jgi:hypothetical protein
MVRRMGGCRAWIFGVLAGCTFTPNTGHAPGDTAGAGGDPPATDARIAGPDSGQPPPVDAPPDAGPPLPCPAQYTLTDANHPGSQYRIVTASATWTDAEATCEADQIAGMTQPAHLVVLDDAAEVALLWNHTNSDQWAGHSDRVAENAWLPVTDQPGVFTGATTGNNNGRNCLVITGATNTSADSCMTGHPYACECDGRAADPNHF